MSADATARVQQPIQTRPRQENVGELLWVLAKTDFKLRYHGSVLGYVWALLKPLLLFTILNFVFSNIFNPAGEDPYYSLKLLTGIMLFEFFSEGTNAGLMCLQQKGQLVTATYAPRWMIVIGSTLTTALVFLMNLVIIAAFFFAYGFVPTVGGVGMFVLFATALYGLIVAFSLLTSALYLRFRDLQIIWEVGLRALFFASLILYPISILPAWSHSIILLNPLAFIVHFTKTSLIGGHYPELEQTLIFVAAVIVSLGVALSVFRKLQRRAAETL